MNANELLLLIICSPSGAGKTTLTRRLLQQFPDFTFSVSHTTRKPRPTEVDGKDYHFIKRPAFEKMVQGDAFLEWAEVHGNLYGTGASELTRALEAGKRGILFDIDHQGARQIRARFPGAVGVFVLPPSMQELRRRLTTRASDDAETIERRFRKARDEIEHYAFFDYLIVNDDLDRATAELAGVAYAEQCRARRLAGRAEELLRSTPVE